MSYDKRNSPYRPSEGFVSTFVQEVPLISDNYSVINGYQVTGYNEIMDNSVLSVGIYTRAINSLQSGAFEFIQKPFDKDRLLNFVKRADENSKLKKENKSLQNKIFHTFEIIGKSQNIISIRDQIQKLSSSESRVFISGPTGSGKELLARKIHKNSKSCLLYTSPSPRDS
mgnify:CR=1 FL=1